MRSSAQYLNPSEAARRLGVSAKALRLYEQRGLLAPVRTEAGWRAYGPVEMDRAEQIAALRALGLSLAQVGRVLAGDAKDLEPALAAHQQTLEGRARQLAQTMEKVRALRADLARGRAPEALDLARLFEARADYAAAFDLPWPWGGESWELRDVRALTFIVGPLGSGKTRLAIRLAETLPGGAFLSLDRLEGDAAAARARLDADPDLKARVEAATTWIVEEGGAASNALLALLLGLEHPGPVVVDMLEQGLDEATQGALVAHLRRRSPEAPPVFALTRSCAILDLASLGPDEAVILCPANHRPPTVVAPYPGAPGYEAVASCLAPPEVRARTEGMVAQWPAAAHR